jgi:putative DNA primase/helicase
MPEESSVDAAAAQVVNLNFWREGKAREDDRRGGGGGPPAAPPPGDEGPAPTWASDDELALQLAGKLVGDWHYVKAEEKWLSWDGQRWRADQRGGVTERVRMICRATSAKIDSGQLARQVCKGSTIASVERLARSDDRIGRTTDEFDSDPMLLNTPGGIVDLSTGELHPHDRRRLMTQMAGAAPAESSSPAWARFLREITDGDRDYEDYLQRLVGYSLTGSTEEEIFVFLHGPSNTGKSKFVELLRALHGTYAGNASMSTFVATQAERHTQDIAKFVGKRLVTAAETDEGRRWDQQRMTQLTGRDLVDAHFMHKNDFSYYPQCLLLFHGNHRPRLSSIASAMRRRMHLLPFMHRPSVVDKHLIDKLKSELGGIMRWAVLGAVLWRLHGLRPPPIVTRATNEYFIHEDILQAWIDERCNSGPPFRSLTRDLYADYKEQTKAAGEYVLPQNRFVDALEGLGFDRWQEQKTRRHGIVGLALKGQLDGLLV